MTTRVEIFSRDNEGRRQSFPIWKTLVAQTSRFGDYWQEIDDILARYNGRIIRHRTEGFASHLEFDTDEDAVQFILEWG